MSSLPPSLRLFFGPLLLTGTVLLLGCVGEDERDGLYLLAAQALGSDAHRDREVVVNPLFLAPGNPRLPERALALLREGGYDLMGPEGEEDSGMATFYFSPPDEMEDGGYQLRVFVSLGARPGTLDRGDTWWRVLVDCPEACVVREVVSLSPMS